MRCIKETGDYKSNSLMFLWKVMAGSNGVTLSQYCAHPDKEKLS